MKTFFKGIVFVILFSLLCVGTYQSFLNITKEEKEVITKNEFLVSEIAAAPVEEYAKDPIVYDGLTLEELSDKLNRSLGSTLSGTGEIYASYCLEKGVDPYLAVAITLHETGCKWGCSYLTRVCYNVGGQKGRPSCNGGSYMQYPTLEEGIKGYIDNLYNGYISKGYTTPEQIGPIYAGSTSWVEKIYYYMNEIRAS